MYQAAWKRFYVAKPRPDEGNGWLRGTQLVLMTSAGRLLSGSVKDRNGLAQALEEVLAAYAQLPEAERRPVSVEGEVKPQEPPPPGGLVLTIYDRPLGRTNDGRYRLPEGNDFDGFRTHAPHGQRSSLWLTAEECKSLIPQNPQKGQTLTVSSKLARRIWLYGLVPQTLWVVEESWKPYSVREGELLVTIEEVTPQVVRLRLHGSVLLSGPGVLHEWPNRKFIKNVENRYDARLEGVLVYDRTQQRITRWDMAALGGFSGRWFAGNKGWKEATPEAPLPLGFAFEVDSTAYELPPERRRPRSFMHAYIFRASEEHYWDPDRWLEDWKKRQPK
ncbi:MAG: hypothetical protein L0Z62_06245 [Gemmataceae bacterium]|nr:hypothetical protein [Gemmataceae bacterium]